MHPEMRQVLRFAAVMAALTLTNYMTHGTIYLSLLAVVGPLTAVVTTWGVLAVVQASGRERMILENLSKLGGRATLSELEATLFDGSANHEKAQRLRESLVFLKERGRIIEADDHLVLGK